MISTIWPTTPGAIIRYRRTGLPIRLIADRSGARYGGGAPGAGQDGGQAGDGQATGQDGTSSGQGGWAPTLTNGNAARRRIIVRKCLTPSKVALEYEKSRSSSYAVTFTAYYVSGSAL
jgi:hypothetical protein